MPFESENQRKAMYAAAAGKSNIGIPEKVAKKFIKHSEDDEFSGDDWLKGVLLTQMLKDDNSGDFPEEPTLLSTPEFKEDGEIEVRTGREQLKPIQNEIAQIAQLITEYKKDQSVAVPRHGLDADPCWEGYTQYGMKEKDGKSVPNCVPDSKDDAADLTAGKPLLEMPISNNGGALGRAAGIMFVTGDGETLLIRRGNGGDYPGTWCVPGGHQNEKDSSLEEAARRECFEETGLKYDGKLEVLYDDGQFCTYIARNVKKEDVKLNYESTGYDWCNTECPPLPLHPSLDIAFKIASAKTETDVAKLMMEGLIPSPQMYANIMLLAIRITGTGLAYRSSIGENVWRDPSLYLNDEFLQRCNGLMVIMDHPETQVLTSKEFKDRAVGSIMLPYIKGDEVWGIAKIYDQDAVNEICEGEISTSPSVVFDNTAGNTTLTTENGDPLLIEGVPFLLDHIAIVTKARGSKGVWDKGGDPAGVLLTNPEVSDMTEKMIEPKADAQGEKLDAILSALGNLAARVDSMEKDLPAEPLVTAADKKAKKDDDSKHRKDDDEEEEEAKKDDDAKMKKHRKDDDDDAMCDDDEEDDRKDAEGSNPVVHGKAGEIKPDDEEAKMDDDEEEAAKKDEEEAMYADAQAKADSVYAAFGKSASRPLVGENLMSYRKRMVRGLQAYSDAYKDVNLTSIKDAKLLAIAEKQIFADALMAAKSPTMYAADQLIEIHEKDRAGRTITKFKGAMEAWLGDFKVPSMRVKSFNLNNNQR
jgi:8-oxo-dGTP pyrophosphatase MutT (NUDIX family)